MRSNWFTSFFSSSKVEELEKEIIELKIKLQEKQEHIDKTNAYWKKKMHQNSKKEKL